MTSKKTTYFTEENFQKFLNAIPKFQFHSVSGSKQDVEQTQLRYKLLYYCALKFQEVVKLTKSNFDLENGILELKHSTNTPKQTTIPPIVLSDVKTFVKKIRSNDYIFKMSRHTFYYQTKRIGEIAGLTLFKGGKKRNVEGAVTVLFRDSYWHTLVQNEASKELANLKLRHYSATNYEGNTIKDLKKIEAEIYKTKFLSIDEIQECMTWYQTSQAIYKKLANEVHRILNEILERRGIDVQDIKSREKTLESFQRKLQDGVTYDPKDMQDLAGIRIICFVKSDIKKVCDAIEDTFDVLRKKDTLEKTDSFSGYSDIQYVCKLTKARISSAEELKQFVDKNSEIQVRTILQDAWAEIEHDDIYKNTANIPDDLRRRFFLVSNVLESADNELDNLHNKIKDGN